MAQAALNRNYIQTVTAPDMRTPPLSAAELLGESYAYAPQPARQPWHEERPSRSRNPQNLPKPKRSGDADKKEKKQSHSGRYHYAYVSPREKSFIFAAIVVLSAIFFMVIMLSAYHASVRNDINVAKARAAAVQEDIDELSVLIEREKNIGVIEKVAKKELGMVHPGAEQTVYLEDIKLPDTEQEDGSSEKNSEGLD